MVGTTLILCLLLFGINYYDKTKSLLPFVTEKEKWQQVSKNLGIIDKVNCYEKMPVSRGSTYRFHNLNVSYDSLKLKAPSICPMCVKSKQYLPSKWDHRLITACTTHNIKLIDTCVSCNEQIKWKRRGILTCACGETLDSSKQACIDTKATKFIESVLKQNDSDTFELLFSFFETFEQFFKNLNIEIEQHQLAEFSGQFWTDKKKLKNSLLEYIKKAALSYGLHPRLTMEPFLSSHKTEINEFAAETLKEFEKSDYRIKKKLNTFNFHIKLRSSEKVLGISPHLNRELIKNSFLNIQKDQKIKSISISSINELLKLFTNSSKPKKYFKTIESQIINNPTNNIKLIDVIKGIKSGKVKISGMQVSSGILSAQSYSKSKEYTFFKPKDVADICGVNLQYIHYAIDCGIIKIIDGTSGTTRYIDEKVAIDFNKKYIFTTEIAKKHKSNSKTASAKIISAGVSPVSGPGIDNGIIYLFKRSDINSLDLKKVLSKKNYKTNAGRKKKGVKTKNASKIPSVELRVVANNLGISIPKSASLIKKGFLKKLPNTSREILITKESFESVKNIQNNFSLIALKEASEAVGESESIFIRHWVNSKQVKLIENGIDRFISKKGLVKVKKLKSKYVTSKEAGILTNTHRTHMLNLEKQNLIKPVTQLKTGKQFINLYDREQVLKICK